MVDNTGYDAVVDVDEEGDLGHTDLQDLEFHQSSEPYFTSVQKLLLINIAVDYIADQTTGNIPKITGMFVSK